MPPQKPSTFSESRAEDQDLSCWLVLPSGYSAPGVQRQQRCWNGVPQDKPTLRKATIRCQEVGQDQQLTVFRGPTTFQTSPNFPVWLGPEVTPPRMCRGELL